MLHVHHFLLVATISESDPLTVTPRRAGYYHAPCGSHRVGLTSIYYALYNINIMLPIACPLKAVLQYPSIVMGYFKVLFLVNCTLHPGWSLLYYLFCDCLGVHSVIQSYFGFVNLSGQATANNSIRL